MRYFVFRGNYMKNNQKSSIINQKQKPTTQLIDSGRSMVEMLGTLAIIGVLSIGGIAGYTYAMKKYQVNKIVNELNLLNNQIAMIMAQPYHDDFELSLGEPYDEGTLNSADYAFNFGCGSNIDTLVACKNTSGYFMELKNIPYDICPLLVQMTPYLTYLSEQKVNDSIDLTGAHCTDGETGNALTLLFETEKSDDNTGKTQVPTPCENNSECPEFCDTTSKTCKTCSEMNPSTPKWNGSSCVTCAQNSVDTPIWNNGKCVSCPPEAQKWDAENQTCVPVECPDHAPYYHNTSETCVTCYTNAHCVKNDGITYYCYTEAGSRKEEIITTSECKEAKKLAPKEGASLEISSKWAVSDVGMTYWSAQRFCEAVGKPTMLSVADLNCKDENIGKKESEGGTKGTCYDADKSDDEKSLVLDELYEAAYGDYYGWTSTAYASWGAYAVNAGTGYVRTNGSGDMRNHAICK